MKVDRDDVPLRPLSTSIHPDGLADVTGRVYCGSLAYFIHPGKYEYVCTFVYNISISFLADENAIHIGGVKVTNDPRFTDYDHFDGCISSKSENMFVV